MNKELFVQILDNYENVSLKKILPEFKSRGFVYKLIERTPEKMLYEQISGGHTVGYEVIKNKISEYKDSLIARFPSECEKYQYCEQYAEIWPSDEDFGKRAWTYPTLNMAKNAYDRLV